MKVKKKMKQRRDFFGFSFWAKFGHWNKVTPKIALDHWVRGGKIRIRKS